MEFEFGHTFLSLSLFSRQALLPRKAARGEARRRRAVAASGGARRAASVACGGPQWASLRLQRWRAPRGRRRGCNNTWCRTSALGQIRRAGAGSGLRGGGGLPHLLS